MVVYVEGGIYFASFLHTLLGCTDRGLDIAMSLQAHGYKRTSAEPSNETKQTAAALVPADRS